MITLRRFLERISGGSRRIMLPWVVGVIGVVALQSQEAGYDWIVPISGNVIDASLDGTRILTFTSGNALVLYNGLTGDPIDTIRRKTINESNYEWVDSSENGRGVIVSGNAVTYSHSSHRDSANRDLIFITRYREATRTVDTIGAIDRRIYYPGGEVCHLSSGHRPDQFLISLFRFYTYCIYLEREGTTLAFTIDGDTLRFDGVVPMTDRDKFSPQRTHSIVSTVHYHSGEVRPYKPPRTWRSAGGRLNGNPFLSYDLSSDDWYPFDNGLLLVRPYDNMFRFGNGREFSIAGVTEDHRRWYPFSTNHYVYTISRDVANAESVVGRFIVRDLISEGEDTLGAFKCDATFPLSTAILAPEGDAVFVPYKDSLVRISVDYSRYADALDSVSISGPDTVNILDSARLGLYTFVDGVVTGIRAECEGADVRVQWDTIEVSPTRTGLLDLVVHVEIDSQPSKTKTLLHQIHVPRPRGVVAFDRAIIGVVTRLKMCGDTLLVPDIYRRDTLWASGARGTSTSNSRTAGVPQQVDDGFLLGARIVRNVFDCDDSSRWRYEWSADSNSWYDGGPCEQIQEVDLPTGSTTVWGRIGESKVPLFIPEIIGNGMIAGMNRTRDVVHNTATGKRAMYWSSYHRHSPSVESLHEIRRGNVWIMPDSPVDQFYYRTYQAYSADAGYGDYLIMTTPFDKFTTSITSHDFRTDETKILLKNIGQANWRMTDAIMVTSRMIVSTYGIHEADSSGLWSTTLRWPYDDVIDVVRLTPTRSCLVRYRTDSVAAIVDHSTGTVVDWLGDCFDRPRCGLYDAQRRLLWLGTNEGLVVGYNVATAVSVDDQWHEASQNRPIAWITENSLRIRTESRLQTIELYAINGVRVLHTDLADESGLIELNCGRLPVGVYVLRVLSSGAWSSTVVSALR